MIVFIRARSGPYAELGWTSPRHRAIFPEDTLPKITTAIEPNARRSKLSSNLICSYLVNDFTANVYLILPFPNILICIATELWTE
jgi:hypothetical protein